MKTPHLARHARRRSRTLLLGLLALAVLGSSPAPAQQKVKDYSAGFKKFYLLGLPDVSGASYVMLNAYRSQGFDNAYYLHQIKLSGNAWMLEENKEGASRFVAGQCRTVTVYDFQVLTKLQQKEREEKAKASGEKAAAPRARVMWNEDDSRVGGNWKKANAEGDLDKLIAYMKKQIEEPEEHNWVFQSGGYGTFFLYAVHFHKMGFADKANELVDLLFTHAADRRKVLMEALNKLADSRYETVCDAFAASGDWAAFEQDLKSMLARFSMGWKKGLAVKRLQAKLTARADSPEAPPVEGEFLTEEDQALAQELAEATNPKAPTRLRSADLWVLPSSRRRAAGDDHVIDRIMKRGMKSVPLLLALLGDDTLTRLDATKLSGQSHSSYFSSRDGIMTEEQVTQQYNAMRRPASRSDIAMLLLAQAMPQGDDRRRSSNDVDWEELQEEGLAWYRKSKDQTPEELARQYMAEGDSQQKQGAMRRLLKSGDETDIAAIEAHLLGSDRIGFDTSTVEQYVKVRGEKAKDFVDKYEAAVKQRQESGDNAEMYKQEGVKKMVDRTLASLREIVSTLPAAETLEEVLNGNKTWDDASDALYRRLANKEPDEALTTVLGATLRTKDPQLAANLIHLAAEIPSLGRYQNLFAFDEEEQEEKELDIQAHAEAWTQLLADTRTDPNTDVPDMTIGQATAWTIERLYDTEHGQAAGSLIFTLGRPLQPLLRARAEERLAGKAEGDLTALPSADNVTEEDRQALVARILAAKPDELAALLDGLGLDQRLALAEAADDDDAQMDVRLTPVANRVLTVTSPDDPDLAKPFEGIKGRALDPATVEALHALCGRLVDAGRITTCSVSRQPCLAGVDIRIGALSPGTPEFESRMKQPAHYYGYDGNETAVSGVLSANELFATAVWIHGAAAAANTEATETDDDDLLDEIADELDEEQETREEADRVTFWQKVGQFCQGTNNVCRRGNIEFRGMPAQPKTENAGKGPRE